MQILPLIIMKESFKIAIFSRRDQIHQVIYANVTII